MIMEKNVTRFGERKEENGIPVFFLPSYVEARQAAISLIENHKDYGLTDSDFWIQKTISSDRSSIYYKTLILSHNGVRKINAGMPAEKQFNPYYLLKPQSRNAETGAGEINLVKTAENSFTLTYFATPDATHSGQQLYMVAEINPYNLSMPSYPFAILQKRLFDRVVLDLSGLAYGGIYGEDEAESFAKNAEPVVSAAVSAGAAIPAAEKVKEKARKEPAPAVESVKPVKKVEPKVEPVNAANQVAGMKQMPAPTVSSESLKMTFEEACEHQLQDQGIPKIAGIKLGCFLKGTDGKGVVNAVKAINTLKIIAGNSSIPADREACRIILDAYAKDQSILVVRA